MGLVDILSGVEITLNGQRFKIKHLHIKLDADANKLTVEYELESMETKNDGTIQS